MSRKTTKTQEKSFSILKTKSCAIVIWRHIEKHVAFFGEKNTNEKNAITWQDFLLCVCGDMTMTWGEEEDAEPDIGQRNRNRMDLNQSPFVMAFGRMLMSYDRYRMMLIIIFVVTTTFSRRRSALLYTKYIVREKEEKWIFLKQLKHVLSLHPTVGICYIGCGSGKLVS